MGNLLFSPSGRIGPSAYMKGILIIALVNLVLGLLPLLGPAMAALGIIGLVTFYIFIALGIKRSHDAGKSGWMVITHILLAIGVGAVIGIIIGMITGVSIADAFGAGMSGDVDAAADFAAKTTAAGYVIPSAIGSFVSQYLTGFLVNMFNKQDMGDNQYGPVPLA